jgi:benzil reductase ((S)-benzoin forming)
MRLLILTGGSRGIGLAIAEELSARGCTVIEFSRTAPHPYSVATDLAAPLAAHRAVDAALAAVELAQLEELFVVSNAATLEPIGPSAHQPPAWVLNNLSINLVSPVLFLSAVVARFQAVPCRKVIANISAGGIRQGVHGWSLYCAAKMGMENFVQSVAIEQQAQAHPFIPVNIDPGVVDTQMHLVAGSASPGDFPAAPRFAARRAQGQLTSPRGAGSAIARLLLSPALTPGSTYDARDIEA